MLNVRRPRTLVTALMVATLAACGGPQEPADPAAADNEAVIVVDNTQGNQANLTIDLVPAQGVERRLGRVSLNQEEDFRVSNVNWGVQYRLVAESISGQTLRSQPFTLSPGMVVEWNINLNSVRTGKGAGL